MALKIFVRERRKVEAGEKKPRFRVVAVSGGDLQIHVEHIRKQELEQLAKAVGAKIVYLKAEQKGKGKGKTLQD
jgi:uncharacterized protein (DUF1501 family)